MSDETEEPAPEPAPHAGMRGKVVSGTFWFMSGTAARAVVRIAVMAALARILTPADFGVIGAASIFILFADLFAIPGIVSTLVQQKELDQRHIGTAFVSTLVTALIVMGLFELLAKPISAFFGMGTLEPILRVLAVLLPLNAVSAVSQKLLEREMMFKRLATIEVASYVFGYAVISIGLAVAGFGVWALVWAQVGSAAVRNVLVFSSQPHNVWRGVSFATYAQMMRLGTGYSLARYFNVVAQKGDYLVVGRTLGAVPLGLYERAYVLMDLSNSLLTNALSTILFSAFSRLQDDREALGRAYLRVSATLALIFCSAAVAAAILAPEIVRVLLGPQWSEAVLPFQVLAFGMFFRTGYKIATVVTNSLGRVYRSAAAQAVYALAVIGGAWLTVSLGITGVAASTLVALALLYGMLSQYALAGIGLRWLDLLRAYRPALVWCVLTALASGLSAAGFRHIDAGAFLTLVGSLTIAGGVVVGATWLFPTILGEHGEWMLDLLRRRFPNLRTTIDSHRRPS